MAERNEDDFSEVISCLARKHASPVSIHDCSPEILEMVFLCLVHGESSEEDGWDWTIILRVCQLWHNIAMNNLSLWAHVNSFRRQSRVKAFLERSNNADLTVYYYEKDIREGIEDVRNLELAFNELPRIRSLVLHSSIVVWCEIKDVLASSAPRLQELDLTVSSVSPHTISHILSLSVSHELMPDLRVLRLSGLSLIPPTSHLQRLKIFEMKNTRSSGRMDKDFSLDTLFRILDNCPLLEELHLTSIGSWDNILPQSIVNLPFLRRLIMADVHFDICSRILDYINLPDGLIWSISCTGFPSRRSTEVFPKLLGRSSPSRNLNILLGRFGLKVTEHTNNIPSTLVENELSLGMNPSKGSSVQELYQLIKLLLKCNRWKHSTDVTIEHDTNWSDDFAKYTGGELRSAILLPQRFFV